MSLIRKLWIAIGCIALAALLTASAVNVLSAKRYLESELRVKNLDAANALALTISTSASDDVTAGLLVSSQFDLGHYRQIEFFAPDGRLVLERERVVPPAGVPAWFTRLLPIKPEPGIAVMQSGWRQLGSIRLQSDPSFAYASLWTSVQVLGLLFLAGGVVLSVLGTLFIRSIMRPLKRVVEQARALVQRRYIEIKPPSTLEFRHIIEALNHHTRMTKELLDDEGRRLEELKKHYETDALTGLLTREVFLRHVQSHLQGEKSREHGCLLMVRLDNLAELNETLGRVQVDGLLRELSAQVRQVSASWEQAVGGRLGARDLGLLVPGLDEPASMQLQIQTAVQSIEALRVLVLRHGSTLYASGQMLGDLLHACDRSLIGDTSPTAVGDPQFRSAETWGRILDQAVAAREWRLALFPVRGRDGVLLFRDGFARIESSVARQQLTAGAFLPWATRRGLAADVDLAVLGLALEQADGPSAICVNLGYQSVCDERITRRVIAMLQERPQAARNVLVEIPEKIAFEHHVAFEHFCRRVLPLGCRVGIEHLDHYLGHISKLHGLGLNHLKISAKLTHGIGQELQGQAMLRGLCTVAHTLGLQVIAEGVTVADEVPLLHALGFDGVSGTAIVS